MSKYPSTRADAEHLSSNKLPRKDSNLDYQYQKLVCYHYTTGYADRFARGALA
jgi:hypothetical protein